MPRATNHPFYRWTARLTGTLVSCGILGMMLSQVTGPGGGSSAVSPQRIENILLGVIVLSALALIGGWHHEALGGSVATAGGLILVASALLSPPLKDLWTLGLSFAIPGLLFLASAFAPSPTRTRNNTPSNI